MKDLGVLLSELAEIKELNKKNKEIENDLIKSHRVVNPLCRIYRLLNL